MHWALIVELDHAGARISVDDLRQRARQRADSYDLLRYGVRDDRLRTPRLVLHRDWDVAANVCSHEAADQLQTRKLLNVLMATALDRDRPLWRLDLIDQQQPNRQLLVLQVHHAVADGLAGNGFAVLFADADAAKLREYERFLVTPRLCPEVPTDIADPVVAFTKSWIAGMTLRRHLPTISDRGARETAHGREDLSAVRHAAAAHGASLSEHLLATTAAVIGRHSGRSSRHLRLGSAVSLDDALRHTGNATSVIIVDIDHTQPVAATITSIRDQLDHARQQRIEMAFVASQRRNGALPWPVQCLLTRTTSRLFRTDAAVSVNPLLLNIKSVFGNPVSCVYGLVSPVRFPVSVVYLLSARQLSYGLVADPHALPYPITRIADALGRQIVNVAENTEVAAR